MSDSATTLQSLKNKIDQFIEQRDWKQFHNPKNLSMAISAEAAELLEHFLWMENKESFQAYQNNKTEIEHEIADIAFAVLALCNNLNIDLSEILERKIAIQAAKYPVEKAKGKYTKYTKL